MTGTPFTVTLRVTERTVTCSGAGASVSYTAGAPFATGRAGVIANQTATTFDDFKLYEAGFAAEPVTRRIRSSSSASLSGGKLAVDDSAHGGITRIEGMWAGESDAFIFQAEPSSYYGTRVFCYQNPGTYYSLKNPGGTLYLYRTVDGSTTTLQTISLGIGSATEVRVRVRNNTTARCFTDRD